MDQRYVKQIYEVYAQYDDITFIMEEYYDTCAEQPISTEVVGFYYGTPDPEATKEYYGKRKATY